MIPAAFDYAQPKSLPEAVRLLQQHPDEAKVLAGGQSLIPLMKFRLAQPTLLVDVNSISELAFIQEVDGELRIGALTRESALETAPSVRDRYPILLETTEHIADPLVRNLATVGGNVAHGDPANDHPATMLALRATVVMFGPNGTRTIPIDEFFVDTFQTALQPEEILTEIRVPAPTGHSGGAYMKLERKVGDFAIVGVAAQLRLGTGGAIDQIGIGLTNVGVKPLRAAQAEAFLLGKQPDEANLRRAGELAAEDAHPTADIRGSVEYRRAMVRTLTFRALRKAVERAS